MKTNTIYRKKRERCEDHYTLFIKEEIFSAVDQKNDSLSFILFMKRFSTQTEKKRQNKGNEVRIMVETTRNFLFKRTFFSSCVWNRKREEREREKRKSTLMETTKIEVLTLSLPYSLPSSSSTKNEKERKVQKNSFVPRDTHQLKGSFLLYLCCNFCVCLVFRSFIHFFFSFVSLILFLSFSVFLSILMQIEIVKLEWK